MEPMSLEDGELFARVSCGGRVGLVVCMGELGLQHACNKYWGAGRLNHVSGVDYEWNCDEGLTGPELALAEWALMHTEPHCGITTGDSYSILGIKTRWDSDLECTVVHLGVSCNSCGIERVKRVLAPPRYAADALAEAGTI